MKVIMSSGKVPQPILVDDDVYTWASKVKWFLTCGKNSARPYARRKEWRTEDGIKKRYMIILHRVIMGNPTGKFVDHKDGNVLNNQRDNLRLVTPYQNSVNRKANSEGSSKYLGVHKDKRTGLWRAATKKDSKWVYIGLFDREEDAALFYNIVALAYHGEYAKLNIITP